MEEIKNEAVEEKKAYEKPELKENELGENDVLVLELQKKYDKLNNTTIQLGKQVNGLKSKLTATMGLSFLLLATVAVLTILLSNQISELSAVVTTLMP